MDFLVIGMRKIYNEINFSILYIFKTDIETTGVLAKFQQKGKKLISQMKIKEKTPHVLSPIHA